MKCKYENAYGDKCEFHLINHNNGFIPLEKIEWWSKGCDYHIELEAWENQLLISQWIRINDELRDLKTKYHEMEKKLKSYEAGCGSYGL